MASLLQQQLEKGAFAVTAEFGPPKGTDFEAILKKAEKLIGRVHGVNCTDGQGAAVRAGSLALSLELMRLGLEPVMQITGRDRNRIAVQSELLSAGHFGIRNLLCITGDHPICGDCPEAKPVFELDAVTLLQTAATLNSGVDLNGNPLSGKTAFLTGAAVSPAFEPLELQIFRMRQKIAAGARFFQSQAVFDIDILRRFREQSAGLGVPVIIGIIPLKSAGTARFLNRNIPGISVPESVIKRMAEADDPKQEGLKIASEMIRSIQREGLAEGVSIMAIGAEETVPMILDAAGIA